jgi:hypothetical protein
MADMSFPQNSGNFHPGHWRKERGQPRGPSLSRLFQPQRLLNICVVYLLKHLT